MIHRWHTEVLERREHAALPHAVLTVKAYQKLTDNQRSRLMREV